MKVRIGLSRTNLTESFQTKKKATNPSTLVTFVFYRLALNQKIKKNKKMKSCLIAFFTWMIYIAESENLQYAFAHKCNDPSVLGSILAAGVNAIEIDVCYGKKNKKWYVSHMTAGICNNRLLGTVTLTSWLTELKNELDKNVIYANQLAMIWLDIKTPGDSHMNELPTTVQTITSQMPSELKILYDLTDFNSESKNGFQQIKNLLNSNEGISFCVGGFCKGDLETIEKVHNYYKTEGFERGTLNHGALIRIHGSDEILQKANLYDFKLVLIWTIDDESDMEFYMDPTNPSSTNGQIVGYGERNWDPAKNNELIIMFQDVSDALGARLATANDNPFCASN
eukprot:305036_1